MTRRDFGKPAFSLRKKRFVKTHALSLLGTTRLLSRSDGLRENSSWEISMAPRDFGAFSYRLLIGNLGDGIINFLMQFSAILRILNQMLPTSQILS
jgi:hypothetical protein